MSEMKNILDRTDYRIDIPKKKELEDRTIKKFPIWQRETKLPNNVWTTFRGLTYM